MHTELLLLLPLPLKLRQVFEFSVYYSPGFRLAAAFAAAAAAAGFLPCSPKHQHE